PTPGGPASSEAPGGGTGGGTTGNPGGGGVAASDPGSGARGPVGPTPVDPGANQPHLEIPKPGQQNPHPVAVQSLQASVDGRHALIKVTWYGGVAPGRGLDSVRVDPG